MSKQYVSRFFKITEDMKKRIIELWELGKSGSEIGDELGITRNSVIGAIYRLRKQGHILSSHENSAKNPINAQKNREKSPVIEKIKESPPIPQKPRVKGMTMSELKYYSCRYILEEGNYDTTRYCGERVERCSYCPEHYSLCYYPARTSLEKLIKH